MARLPQFTASRGVPSTTGVTSMPRTDLKLGVMGAAFSQVGAATNQLGMTLLQDAAEDHADNAALGAQMEILTAKANIEQNGDPLAYVDSTMTSLDTIYTKATKGMSQFSTRRFDQKWNSMAASAISAAQVNMVKRGREKSEGALITLMNNALTGAEVPELEDLSKQEIFNMVMTRVEEKRAAGIIDDPKAAKLAAGFKKDYAGSIVQSWINGQDPQGMANALVMMRTNQFGEDPGSQLAGTFWGIMEVDDQTKVFNTISTRISALNTETRATAAAETEQRKIIVGRNLITALDTSEPMQKRIDSLKALTAFDELTPTQFKVAQEAIESGGIGGIHNETAYNVAVAEAVSGKLKMPDVLSLKDVDAKHKSLLFPIIQAAQEKSFSQAKQLLLNDPVLSGGGITKLGQNEMTATMRTVLTKFLTKKDAARKEGPKVVFDDFSEMANLISVEKVKFKEEELQKARDTLADYNITASDLDGAMKQAESIKDINRRSIARKAVRLLFRSAQ